jgi:anaerobic magnesium-protoporphyrin IX monomethyl ester cyclase
MKCLLIQAKMPVKYLSVPPPIGVAYLASYLKKDDFEVKLMDAYAKNHDISDIVKFIKAENPDFLGISAVTSTINNALKYCEEAKKINPNIKTVLGGAHPSIFPKEILRDHKQIDFIVEGEGELTISELLKAHQNNIELESIDGLTFRNGQNIIKNKKRDYITDLDSIPFPAWDLLPYDSYKMKVRKGTTLYMLGSRGCPFNCDYCAISAFWRNQRRRSPQNIMSEIEHFSHIYDLFTIVFFDPMFCLKREWVISICKEIIDRGFNRYQYIGDGGIGFMDPEMLSYMKKANFMSIQFGIEFGSQKVLDSANKKIKVEDAIDSVKMTKAAGINVSIAIMMGYPGETKETIEESIQLAKKLKPDHFGTTHVIPYPGTKLFEYCKNNNLLRTENWDDYCFNFWDQKKHLIKLEYLTDEELLILHKKAIRTIRYSANYIFKTLVRYPKHFLYSIFFVILEKCKSLIKHKN